MAGLILTRWNKLAPATKEPKGQRMELGAFSIRPGAAPRSDPRLLGQELNSTLG